MKIAIITSEMLVDFPPITTLLSVLDQQGHAVTLITPFEDEGFEPSHYKNVSMVSVGGKKPERIAKYYGVRWKDSIAFHTDRFLKRKYLRKIPSLHQKTLKDTDVVWVLHENTMVLGGKKLADKLGNYLYTMYELCLKNGPTPEIYEYAARKAKLCVVPEYSRAHIAKAIYDLAKLPAIIPNKPYFHPRMKGMEISDPAIAAKVQELKRSGKKIIMYMGILSAERPLEPIMDAVDRTKDYVLAILGPRSPYLDKLEAKYPNRFVYLGFAKPPAHLEVASHADIAYICYVPQNKSINAVFCAPNKVYEFAGFGIPMLSNDIPGLRYLVEYNQMGVCVPQMQTPAFLDALNRLEAERETMGAAAQAYYDSEDLPRMVAEALVQYRDILEDGQ